MPRVRRCFATTDLSSSSSSSCSVYINVYYINEFIGLLSARAADETHNGRFARNRRFSRGATTVTGNRLVVIGVVVGACSPTAAAASGALLAHISISRCSIIISSDIFSVLRKFDFTVNRNFRNVFFSLYYYLRLTYIICA